jgi:hypothetical protein
VTFGLSLNLLHPLQFCLSTAYPSTKNSQSYVHFATRTNRIFYLFLAIFTRVACWLFTNPVSAIFSIIAVSNKARKPDFIPAVYPTTYFLLYGWKTALTLLQGVKWLLKHVSRPKVILAKYLLKDLVTYILFMYMRFYIFNVKRTCDTLSYTYAPRLPFFVLSRIAYLVYPYISIHK